MRAASFLTACLLPADALQLRPAGAARSSLLRMSVAPPEVLEAEAKATPNRKFRLGGAGVGVAISAPLAGLSIASLAGQPDAAALGENVLLFGNAALTLGVSGLIGGSCAWAIQQELKTKEENIAKIWKEVQRRRQGGAKSGENRSQRRAKKVMAPAPTGASGGFGRPSAPPPPPPPQPLYKDVSPPASPPPAVPAAGAPAGGLRAQAEALLQEANAMGRANALVLNAKLEDAGVLPPAPTGEAEAAAPAEPASAPAAGASAPAAESGVAAEPRAVPAKNRRAKGKKGKRKSK